jgi:hypothetical protein
MFRIHSGTTPRYCDGHRRRDFLALGAAGLASFGLGDLLRARAAAKEQSGSRKETSVILLWLDGGPSQHDTYDPKPEAPAEYRGFWQPIQTNAPGVQITENFPLQAKVADRFSIIRSIHHDSGDHFTGGHWMLTGYGGTSGGDKEGKFPGIGAIATSVTGSRQPGIPAYVGVPYSMSIGIRPGYFGAMYVGAQHNPFEVGTDPNRSNFSVKNVEPPKGISLERLEDRRSLNAALDGFERRADNSGLADAIDEFDQQALELVTGSRARKAFDINAEDPRLRDRYGRNAWGQSTLLARRLVEAGTTFVTCHYGGWDSHWNHAERMSTALPQVDMAVSSLFEDLVQRGLWETTLVIVMGEFGRTPKMNDGSGMGTPGRDHWGNALSVLVGGGGVQGGRIVGSTNAKGEVPLDNPLRPGDLHHTIYKVLGVDPSLHFTNHAGRPVPAIDHGAVIEELF